MKFVISPTKTMKAFVYPIKTKTIFSANEIVAYLQKLTIPEIKKIMKVNDKIAEENYMRYQNFKEVNSAIFTYTGLQYKNLDAPTLTADELTYAQNHLYILSALYGLVRPFDEIGLYRLDLTMNIKIKEKSLVEYWRKPIEKQLKNEVIVSLASKEYEDLLSEDLNVISIKFLIEKDNKYLNQATHSKIARGLFMRECIQRKVANIEELKMIEVSGFKYDAKLSEEKIYVFIKK